MNNNKTIAKNTLYLYFRMMVIIAINLFAVRIILKVLGIEDYGIYNVVGGIVTLFSFLGSSLSSGAQRFFAYEIGQEDYNLLQKVFSMTVMVYCGMAFMIFVLLETVGVWFLNNRMNIPFHRLSAANWVFQFSVLTFILNIIMIPYNAAIIAWERMAFFAYLSIVEAVSKLLCVVSLIYIVGDKLVIYAAIVLIITCILFCIYRLYCIRNLRGCEIVWHYNPVLCKSLLGYSGWNMIGSIALILRNQGVNIVLNLFFTPIVNAAHTIGQQINGIISQFISNIYMSTRPQITKYYAVGQKEKMWSLVFSSSKFSYYLLLFLCLPLFLEIEILLRLWLGEVPEYTSVIVRLLLIVLLIETTVNQIVSVFQAANKIRKFQSRSSLVLLLNIPISYVFLKYTSFVMVPYIVSVALSCVYVVSLLWIAYLEVGLNIKKYISDILFKVLLVSFLSAIIPFLFCQYVHCSLIRFLYTCVLSLLSTSLVIWSVGLTHMEKEYIRRFFRI